MNSALYVSKIMVNRSFFYFQNLFITVCLVLHGKKLVQMKDCVLLRLISKFYKEIIEYNTKNV